jgi:predicted ArsR family transcriptional regulator
MVLEFMRQFTADLPPISATGGWTSVSYIAGRLSMGENAVRERLFELEELGLVRRRMTVSSGTGWGQRWRPM